jgi:hypothetical protein
MPAYYPTRSGFQPMRIQARPGSVAEQRYLLKSALPGLAWPSPKVIAKGINPAPLDDLMYHGGKVVPQMEFQNIYLGTTADWAERDITSIDSAIKRAMQDKRLNNMVGQYFPGAALGCDMRDSFIEGGAKPKSMDESAVQAMVTALYDTKKIARRDLGTALFNLVLPAGTVLKLDSSTSLNGLGGYHGSMHIQRAGKTITLYYSANVYSQMLADGRENGIVSFDRPWKSVVGTLYHEINEFRTDPDINDAITKNNNDFLGWTSRQGYECGDQPIFEAGASLKLVFKQVKAAGGSTSVPVQFLYSNAVHGAEGPINAPH